MDKNKDFMLEDIELPEIVMKKAENALMKIKMEDNPATDDKECKRKREKRKKGLFRYQTVTAACMVLIMIAVFGVSSYLDRQPEMSSAKDNPFYITVSAKRLGTEKGVPLIIHNRQAWALNGSEDNSVSYVINTDFECKGENIKSITYSIHNGVFQIVNMPDSNMILNGKKYKGKVMTGSIGEVESPEGEILTENNYYTEYTLSYDNQRNDTTWINICGEKSGMSLKERIWESNYDLKTLANAYTDMLKDVEITCTANFTDGTSSSKTILVEGQVMTYEEAGMIAKGEELSEGRKSDDEDAVIVFKLK